MRAQRCPGGGPAGGPARDPARARAGSRRAEPGRARTRPGPPGAGPPHRPRLAQTAQPGPPGVLLQPAEHGTHDHPAPRRGTLLPLRPLRPRLLHLPRADLRPSLTGPRAARPEHLATGAAPGGTAHPARPLPHIGPAARGRRRTPRRRGRDAAARPTAPAALQPQHPRRHPRGPLDLDALRRAAAAELAIHADDDADTRAEAAQRARQQLGDAEQIFGNILRNTARLRRTS